MSEIGDACQIVLICGKMIAVTANLSLKLSLLMLKVYNSLYLGKWRGKTAFMRFRAIKGDDYEFINVCTEDAEKIKRVEKEMSQHGLLFARMPDLCGGDGNTQYVIARSDMGIFAAFLMDHLHGKDGMIKVGPVTESDYAKTAVHPESGAYTREFKDLNESAKEAYRAEKGKSRTAEIKDKSPSPFEAGRDDGRDDPELKEDRKRHRVSVVKDGERTEGDFPDLLSDPVIAYREERIRYGKDLMPIFEEPIKETEKWAVFPVHDGFHVVIVPKDDLLSGNLSKKRQYRSAPLEKLPFALLYTNRNYVVMDVRTGEKETLLGKEVQKLLNIPSPAKQRQYLANLSENIAKNIGDGAVLRPEGKDAHRR